MQQQKAAAFRALHEGEAFLIPNPWDAGSARVFEALGSPWTSWRSTCGGSTKRRAFAVERIAAAVEAARGLGFPFVLTARAENHLRGNPDLDDTIARLQAFERAGADVLYAPGLRSADQIRAVCEAVAKPVNVLARPDLSMAEIVAAGAQRAVVGGDFSGLARPDRVREWLADR